VFATDFAEAEFTTSAYAAIKLFAHYPKDPRAIAYARLLPARSMFDSSEEDRFAMQHPLYLAVRISHVYHRQPEDEATLQRLIDEHEEPTAMVALARLNNTATLYDGDRCKALYKRAAELGNIEACFGYAGHLQDDDPQKYYYGGLAAQCGLRVSVFLFWAHKCLENSYIPCLVQIDRMIGEGWLALHRLQYIGEMSSDANETAYNEVLAIQALCRAWRSEARDAVNTWLVLARRLRVCKDMRRVIGLRIWNEWVDGVADRAMATKKLKHG
jgi:hypothetical protein